MANQITNWADFLIASLTTAFPDADVAHGRRSGVSRDKDRIHVFEDGPWVPDARDIAVARQTMVVRYWKSDPKIPDASWPEDPTELEQAKVDMLDALRAVQKLTGLTGNRPWYFIVRSAITDDDVDEWGVEFRLEGVTANEAVIA